MITQERLHELLDYDPDTGVFVWRERRGAVKSGTTAGRIHHSGYREISINNKKYLSHRLAWLYVYGAFPDDQIDHINGVKTDNRLVNLRESTNTQNAYNRGLMPNNSTGLKGVCFNKIRNRYQSQIVVNKKVIYLGTFSSPEEAHAAYCKAAEKLHGEFARMA
tara:strand:- start:3129 stop:3617 length:489 start_codon:yes stop_codon:yes gene_type:complete